MANRLALVVDDSKTARVTLRRMLEQQNLDVDTLESAPEAINYLSSHTPDVIFMDHMMPDMDGFEAVEAIKGNPNTATIPILMYTSKEGDLYVSQARALGALGILPKHVEPAELFEVLNSLGLAKERRSQTGRTSNVVLLEDVPEVSLSAVSGDIRDIAYEAAEAVSGHKPGNHRLVERLADHFDHMLEELRTMRSQVDELAAAKRSSGGLLPLLVFLLMLAPLLWLYNRHLDTDKQLDTATVRINELVATQQRQEDSNVQHANLREQLDDQATSAHLQSQLLYSSIAWAINLSSAYDMRDVAFSDQRLAMIQELLTRLSALGFRGTVQLESHLGDFCLVGDEVVGYRMADDSRYVSDCNLVGHPSYQLPSLGERQSIGFANFMATSPLVNGNGIRIELVNYQNSRPKIPYPPSDAAVSASTWNAIAAANNRVEVTLIPERSAD
ncbi:MAG: response regulator [Gammaproteobacteria bacterium]